MTIIDINAATADNLREMLDAIYEAYYSSQITRDELRSLEQDAVAKAIEKAATYDEALRIGGYVHTSALHEARRLRLLELAAAEGLDVCEHCGIVLDPNFPPTEVVDENMEVHRFCNMSCAREAGWRRCHNCNEWHRADHEGCVPISNRRWFCSEDCAHEASYEVCPQCGNWFYLPYGITPTDSNETYCCEDCARNAGYQRCDHCEEWHDADDFHEVRSGGRWEDWCDSCFDDDARACYECGNVYNENDMEYDDDDDEWYCRSCFGAGALHEYGWHPCIEFYGNAAKSPYLGVELETDGGSDRLGYVRALFRAEGFNDHFWMTKDGSLDNGVEVTSQPCTLAYHANELRPVYEGIRREALARGFQSHNGGRCGLHVHVNRDFFGKSVDSQDLGGYKMMRLLQRFEANFVRFSRRHDTYWCRFSTYETYGPDEVGEPDEVGRTLEKAKKMSGETRHEQALNFQHDDTFEFRIFRGTLNLSTFYAALGMVNGMCHVAKMHSMHYIESVEWSDLMRDVVSACDEPESRERLREYLDSRELL